MGVPAAIVGSGHIGTDLMCKLHDDDELDLRWMVGIDPASEGLARARELGIETSHEGVDWLLDLADQPRIVFEATSAAAHVAHAPRYAAADVVAIDLTPAAVGPFVCPAVGLDDAAGPNVNLITCGGQATIPIVHAVAEVTRVPYAEIVASISSRSAGPGTRASIDEFTTTTASALEQVGRAERGKAIVILNPVVPEMVMRDTVFCAIDDDADAREIVEAIEAAVEVVRGYVPGYRLVAEPRIEAPRDDWYGRGRVTTLLEVTGAGDHLPPWAGNLDIMTAAAAQVGRQVARRMGGVR